MVLFYREKREDVRMGTKRFFRPSHKKAGFTSVGYGFLAGEHLMTIKHALRISPGKLRYYQGQYDFSAEANLDKYQNIGPTQGHLTVSQLHEICRWKSKRRAELALSNPEAVVREITAFAFSAKCEESRLGALTLLEGVGFPTASVILHFCVDQTYPILDFRAIWSLGIEQPSQYTIPFWKNYIQICRALAAKHCLTVRELDMALWQYSNEEQGE